jgi:uncharacterized protein (TIGR02421 family)
MSSAQTMPIRSEALAFDGDGPIRRALRAGGHVHLDRPLPFLMLNRHPATSFSLARRIATISAANVVWPAQEKADAEAASRVAEILRLQRHPSDQFLLVTLYDLPRDGSVHDESSHLEALCFVLGASTDAAAQAVAQCLQVALEKISIELRDASVQRIGLTVSEPVLEPLTHAMPGLSLVSLGIPQAYRVPGEQQVYPQIFHELETHVFDALLCGLAEFVDFIGPADRKPRAERFHRSLARSSFIEAALKVDHELERIGRSFDFLLGVSPINAMQAYEQFREDGFRSAPKFRYRPLTVSPDQAKRELYAIDVASVEDPVLETLFCEKQREIDQQLMMLQRRNTPSFRYVSLLQYGGVEAPLLKQAHAILEHAADGDRSSRAERCNDAVDCHVILAAADTLIARYRHKVPEFKAAKACLREDIPPGLMVSGTSLLISTATRMPRARLDAMLQHEISVHVLTCVNGRHQGLGIFGSGLAEYEGVQEGLGVFAEIAVGGLSLARLRLLAGRVVAVDAMLNGLSFVDCYWLLRDQHRFAERAAFNMVTRVYRSGGLSKDAIYLRGVNQVFDMLHSGRDLEPFWYGKIAERHVPVVRELLGRGMLRKPAATPEFMGRPSARESIGRIRAGEPFVNFIQDSP